MIGIANLIDFQKAYIQFVIDNINWLDVSFKNSLYHNLVSDRRPHFFILFYAVSYQNLARVRRHVQTPPIRSWQTKI